MPGRPDRTPRNRVEFQAMIDRMAREFVESISSILDRQSETIPRSSASDNSPGLLFLATGEQELASLGFRAVGDFEATPGNGFDPAEAFARLLLSGDGLVYAKLLRAPGGEGEPPVEAAMLTSRFPDGSAVTTLRGFPARVPGAPQFQESHLDDDVTMESMLRAHRLHVGARGGAPVPFPGIAEILAHMDHEGETSRIWRQSQGVHFYELLMRRAAGPDYEIAGAPIVESIRAHPWWLKKVTAA